MSTPLSKSEPDELDSDWMGEGDRRRLAGVEDREEATEAPLRPPTLEDEGADFRLGAGDGAEPLGREAEAEEGNGRFKVEWAECGMARGVEGDEGDGREPEPDEVPPFPELDTRTMVGEGLTVFRTTCRTGPEKSISVRRREP